MYRAVVLTTLVLLLLAVAGVTVAQDGRIFAGAPHSDDPTESTTPERTSFEVTGSEDTTTSRLPGASPEPEDRQDIPEPTVVTEPTVVEHEKSTAVPAGGEPQADSGRGVGKPEHAVKAPGPVAGSAEIGQHGTGEPVERRNAEEPGRGVGRQKATLCHKGNKTLTVGAPAIAAHLRHGDYRGACQGGVSGPEPSGEKMEPEAARNGEGGGGGRGKVVLCHKNRTLTVGAPAQAAHLRHGDSLGACR
jgi:hypothetical protein